MKKVVYALILVGCFSNTYAAYWYYDTDGCTKVYAYGLDVSECDTREEILSEAGREVICRYGFCF